MSAPPSLILLTGPTGSGKSSLFSSLCSSSPLPLRLLNSDSMQVYSNLPTACASPSAPPPRSLYGHRDFISHDLLSLPSSPALPPSPLPATPLSEPNLPPSYSAYSRHQHLALLLPLVRSAWAAGAVPCVVGGTMFWNQGLLEALAGPPELDPPPAPGPRGDFPGYYASLADPRGALAERDPGAAASLHPNDKRKIRNALQKLHEDSSPPPPTP
ncbi:hypothetical protein TeGR_g4128, partial [Tetraparma gracilis]